MTDSSNPMNSFGELTGEESLVFEELQRRQHQLVIEAGQLVFRIIDLHKAAVDTKMKLREEFFKIKDRLEIPDGVNFQIVGNQAVGMASTPIVDPESDT